jgi:hypothetical protein
MGRRKGNCLVQRAQRAHQRAQQRLEEAKAAQIKADQAAEAEAKALALQAEEIRKIEARKERFISDYQNGKGFVFRSQKNWGGQIHGDTSVFPFVWVEYCSFPNGSAYYQAKSLVDGVKVENVYSGGTDMGIHFFNRELKEVRVS